MSATSNVYSQGGGGTLYEFEVQTVFFISFLIGVDVPGFTNSSITAFRQQSGSLGYETDDLLLTCVDDSGEHRILLQIKHMLTISSKNDLFREVITAAWNDFKNPELFNPASDRIFLIKSALTLDEKNHLKTMLSWSRVKADVDDFTHEVSKIGAKKKYYDLYKTIVDNIAGSVSDEVFFNFLKCLDILEYDLDQEISNTRSNIITLIALSKVGEVHNPTQIWKDIFRLVADGDSKGAFFTLNTLPSQIKGYLDRNRFTQNQAKLLKFSNQSQEIIDFIEDRIGVVHLNRQEIVETAWEKMKNLQILIISGDAGTGKSSLAKSVIRQINSGKNGYTMIFKADELNTPNLKDLFVPSGIHLTIYEIFAHFPLLEDNIIYIDGFEKLLEGDGGALKQLLRAVTERPGIRLIFSCRQTNLNLITIKFFSQLPFEKIDIPRLSAEEIREIALQLPALKYLIENKRLFSLIQIPKYLDFAHKAILAGGKDYGEMNEPEFINNLWEIIVENRLNENLDGLPRRRNNVFIDISVSRARRMQPFILPGISDEKALQKLLFENVIVQSSARGLYAPNHDVLEDWALIRWVESQFNRSQSDLTFFTALGTEPAVRRAYRLWVQSVLKAADMQKINFFIRNLVNIGLERFWQDESIIALLNSSYFKTFLDGNLELLKQNNWQLLFRIVHIMRTACKESRIDEFQNRFAMPSGFGWGPLINLFHDHIRDIEENYYYSILNMVEDWSPLILEEDVLPTESRASGLVILHILNNYFLKQENTGYRDQNVNRCVRLLFNLCGGILSEVTDLIQSAVSYLKEDVEKPDWKLHKYYKKVLEIALSGKDSIQLAKYLPELLLTLIRENWFRKPRKPRKGQEEYFIRASEGGISDINFHFGLENESKIKYSPSSAYQTPIYRLLRNHTEETIDFIIELINQTTEKYLASEFSKHDRCVNIELDISDGSRVIQNGSYTLWCMYRGTGKVSPHVLQSTLMAFEKYLLEIAAQGDESSHQLQSILIQLYKNSRSIATTAVICSVVQAYPLFCGEQLLPLLNGQQLISWDISRYTADIHPFYFHLDEKLYRDERLHSNRLEHRLKYSGGFKGFIINYCFNIRVLNREIFERLDSLKQKAAKDDIGWKKLLEDIDIRGWIVTRQEKENDTIRFLIEPEYSSEIQPHVAQWKESIDSSNKNSEYSLLLQEVQKKEKTLAPSQWREIYQYYGRLEQYNFMEHTPGLLAMIGIRDHWTELEESERDWSLKFIISIIEKKLVAQAKPYAIVDEALIDSPFDLDASLTIFPFFLELDVPDQEKEDFEILFVHLLLTHFFINDPDYIHFLTSIRNNLWKNSPEKALSLFKGLVAFSRFTKVNPFYVDHPHTEAETTSYNEKYSVLIQNILADRIEWNVEEIRFETESVWSLHKALQILPDLNPPALCISFLEKITQLHLEDELEYIDSHHHNDLPHEIMAALKDRISHIIFWNADSFGIKMLSEFISKMFDKKFLLVMRTNGNDIFRFFRDTVKNLIHIADHNSDETKYFQILWVGFEKFLSRLTGPVFADLLLLNISWNDSAVKWLPMSGMDTFFEKAIVKYGPLYTDAVFNLLSSIGDEMLLPKGINLLTGILKNDADHRPFLSYKHAEKLIRRIYDNHLTEVKSNPELFENYLWMLGEAIDQGSSEAYWIREFIISFRQASL